MCKRFRLENSVPLLEGHEVRPPPLGIFPNGHNLVWGKISVEHNQSKSHRRKDFDLWSRKRIWMWHCGSQIELQGLLSSTFGSVKICALFVFVASTNSLFLLSSVYISLALRTLFSFQLYCGLLFGMPVIYH